MIDLNDDDYSRIAEKLLEAIGNSEFYNGSIEWESDGYSCVFIATLIIYREPLRDPDDPTQSETRITDIVPVWWEFHTYGQNREITNDFSWTELKKYII